VADLKVILKIIGLILAGIGSIIAFFKVQNDSNITKSDILWRVYIFKYPKLLFVVLLGFLLIICGISE